MELDNKTVLVTGGAGFIGSHLVDSLLARSCEVSVVDNLSTGDPDWLHPGVHFVNGDLSEAETLDAAAPDAVDLVIHLAASKQVNTDTPRQQFMENLDGTYALLEWMDDNEVTNLAFASSSTVYGEAPAPTAEDYAPLEPTSPYGASKLAAEGLLSTYAHSHNFTVWNFRLANIVGPRLRGAVIPDFIEKLRENPDELTILGNGQQEKSYMHIDDCVAAMLHTIETLDDSMNTLNLGTPNATSVTEIADIVSEEMGLDPEYEYTGGERGWTGDVPRMCLDVQRLHSTGFTADLDSDGAVRRATQELLPEIE